MIIYELRSPQPECYYMLGLFAEMHALHQAIARNDGGPKDHDAYYWVSEWKDAQ